MFLKDFGPLENVLTLSNRNSNHSHQRAVNGLSALLHIEQNNLLFFTLLIN